MFQTRHRSSLRVMLDDRDGFDDSCVYVCGCDVCERGGARELSVKGPETWACAGHPVAAERTNEEILRARRHRPRRSALPLEDLTRGRGAVMLP